MKYFFSLLVIFFTALPVHSQTDLKFNFNSGSFGIGVNFPMASEYGTELTITLINVGIEDQYRNIGVEFSPLKLHLWTGQYYEDTNDAAALSLVNLNSYWNIVSGKIFVGPFASLNYLFIDDTVRFDRYVATVGMHFGLRFDFQNFNYNFLTAEIGYKNINGAHKYHLGLKIDILSLLFSNLLL